MPVAVLMGALSAAAAAQPELRGLGALPGMYGSRAYAISADGSTVVGTSSRVDPTDWPQTFRWTWRGGFESLGTLFEEYDNQPVGVSGDGSTVVGIAGAEGPRNVIFRWTPNGGMRELALGYTGADAYGVSRDGSRVVGGGRFPGWRGYFVWSDGAGIERLEPAPGDEFCFAQGISPDGSRVLGCTGARDGTGVEACRWSSGSVGAGLGPLPGVDFFYEGYAWAASGDGSIIVGEGRNADEVMRAFRWSEAMGYDVLPTPPDAYETFGRAVSGDGRVVVGFMTPDDDSGNVATMWVEGLGARRLRDWLPLAGLDGSGWIFTRAVGVSADGTTVVGNGLRHGREEAWVARIFCRADVTRDFAVDGLDYAAFVGAFEADDLLADFNADGFIDFFDYADFVTAFEEGC